MVLCGDESQTKFGGFAFFPGKALSKRFLHNVGQRVNNGLKIVVCVGKNAPSEHSDGRCGILSENDHSNTQFWVKEFNCIIIVNSIF